MKNFEKFLFVRKGMQPRTVKSHIDCIIRVKKNLGENPSNEQFEDYVYKMYQSDYSYSHKTNTVLAIEHYTEFLGDPIKFKRQRKPKTIIKDTLTEAEITKMIFNCKNLKEKAIICLLAYSGIRNKELCNLKVEDFDSGRNQIKVIQGKGLKDGISQISADCSRVLQEYININGLTEDDYLFKTYQGNKYTGWALRNRVKVIAKRAKILKRVYPHLFRHSLSVNMLIRGADIITLKNQLRHTLVETTFNYLNSIVLGERNAYGKFEPSYL
jgi:integrase/recombinase XerD